MGAAYTPTERHIASPLRRGGRLANFWRGQMSKKSEIEEGFRRGMSGAREPAGWLDAVDDSAARNFGFREGVRARLLTETEENERIDREFYNKHPDFYAS